MPWERLAEARVRPMVGLRVYKGGLAVILRILLACAFLPGLTAMADSAAAQEAAPPKHVTRKAKPHRPPEGEVYRHVYAEAWYGSQKAVAPVRQVDGRDEVQLPTGEWIACEFSCEITMRKMPLGYWQDQGAGYNRTGPTGEWRPDHWTDGWGYRHGYLF
jgi:hypothetical protein